MKRHSEVIDWLNETLDLDIKFITPGILSTTTFCPIGTTLRWTNLFMQVGIYPDRITVSYKNLTTKTYYLPDFMKEWILKCDNGEFPEIAMRVDWYEPGEMDGDNPKNC